jgi:hypothetical protein
MLRIIYTPEVIIAIMDNNPMMGITYTIERVIVCTADEAYLFFASYPPEEILKIDEYVQQSIIHPDPFESIDI